MSARGHMHVTQEGEAVTHGRTQAFRLFALVFAVVGALAIVLGALLSSAQAASGYKYKAYKVPTENSEPRSITEGSDGNFWFTEGNPAFDEVNGFVSKIGQITPSGAITEFPVDCNMCFLDDIEQGSDGVQYFTANDARLGSITTDGAVDFVVPRDAEGNQITFPYALGSIDSHGDDLWGSGTGNIIWRYDVPTGQFTEFSAGTPSGEVAVDAGGIVWFTAPSAIGSYDPATGVTTPTPVPDDVSPGGQSSSPRHIAVASDGKVWFTDRFNHSVGYLDPANNQVRQFATLTPEAGPQDITAASDDSVWFTQARVGNAAHITLDGQGNATITEEGKAIGDDPNSGLEEALGITMGSDQSVWFTMQASNKIAALEPPKQ